MIPGSIGVGGSSCRRGSTVRAVSGRCCWSGRARRSGGSESAETSAASEGLLARISLLVGWWYCSRPGEKEGVVGAGACDCSGGEMRLDAGREYDRTVDEA